MITTTFEHRRYLSDGLRDPIGSAVDEALDGKHSAYSDYIDDFLARHRPTWWQGANRDEVQAFDLSSCTCGYCRDNRPDGSSIPQMSTGDIRLRLLLASQRLKDPSKRTRWLEGYSARLVAESRRRRGVG